MAISFDAASSTNGTASSFTFSHTVSTSGNHAMLVVGIGMATAAATGSSVTYAGVGMTRAIARQGGAGTERTELWYLQNPSTGANNIIATLSASQRTLIGGASYFGVAGTGNTGGNDNSGVTTIAVTVTGTKSNSFICGAIMDGANNGASITNPASATSRWSQSIGAGANTHVANQHDISTTAPSGITTTFTVNGSSNACIVQLEITPVPNQSNTMFI